MTSADVRARLVRALRLDLVGPEPDEPQAAEILASAPSRLYLTGFLVPWNAPASQKHEDDAQGELEFAEAAAQGDEDETTAEPPAARRGQFPSSLGISVLVPPDVSELRVTARWGDYEPLEADGKPTGEWRRRQRQETVPVRLPDGNAAPSGAPVPDSRGLEIVTSVRRIQRPTDFDGLPAGTRAVSVFLVNRREPLEGVEDLKNTAFAFQASLILESDRPFVPRPNPRGRQGTDPDERIAELQYSDAMEYAVGHGTSTRSVVTDGACARIETRWTPQAEVERVEPASMKGVEFRMETLAAAPDAATLKAALESITAEYRGWIEQQRAGAPRKGPQGEVADDLLQKAAFAATRIDAGVALMDDPVVFQAFRLANRAMAMAARQRRAQEKSIDPAGADPPEWRPFQLAFVLMNLSTAFANWAGRAASWRTRWRPA